MAADFIGLLEDSGGDGGGVLLGRQFRLLDGAFAQVGEGEELWGFPEGLVGAVVQDDFVGLGQATGTPQGGGDDAEGVGGVPGELGELFVGMRPLSEVVGDD